LKWGERAGIIEAKGRDAPIHNEVTVEAIDNRERE